MKDKGIVLITGGTTGIGYELARIFAKNGHDLVIVARDKEELNKAKMYIEKESKVQVTTLQKDLFDLNNAFQVYEEMQGKGIEIEILVNNAGQGEYGKFIETDLAKELNIVQLNIGSLLVLTKLFARDMAKRGHGKILNLSSIASKSPGPWHSVYHATKAFVQSFSEALHYELKEQGIVVTALLPGATDTDFFRKAHMESSKVMEEEMANPEDVAKDGYEALMAGEDMVVSGFKNKVQITINKLRSDETKAAKMAQAQEPYDNDEKKKGKESEGEK